MADKPILFSGPMVRAILEGRKTMTRRVMKPQPRDDYTLSPLMRAKEYLGPKMCGKMGCYVTGHLDWTFFCPPYRPGDTLWVRETWAYATGPNRDEPDTPEHYAFVYREEWDRLQPNCPLDGCWKPSIFMPRWASRIDLLVTDVRAERLQEITEEDAGAEGMPTLGELLCCPVDGEPMRVHSFEVIWNQLNAKRGFPWASNPWVWVVSFERVKP